MAARSQPLVGGHGLPQGMSRPMASRASDCMCSLSSGPGERATNRMGRVLAHPPWMSSGTEVVSQEGSRSLNVDRAAVLLAQLGCQLPWGTDPHAANGEGSLQEGPISIDETQRALYGRMLKSLLDHIHLVLHAFNEVTRSRRSTYNFSSLGRAMPPSVRRSGRPLYRLASITHTP